MIENINRCLNPNLQISKLNQFTMIILLLSGIGYLSTAHSECTASDNDDFIEINKFCKNNDQSESTAINAYEFSTIEDGLLRVSGDVCISMGNQKIITQELLYNDKEQIASINTALNYDDGKQKLQASSANINVAKEQAVLNNVSYFLNQSKANGSAEKFETDNQTSKLYGLTYSTCPVDDQQWYVKAESVDINQQTQIGTFKKMTLRFKNVPLFYLPYAKLPLNNQRKSGLLIPEINNSSTNGLDIAVPYYFNISENKDATLTPRIITKRGAMLGAEFRFMGDNYLGDIYADYLPSDKIDKKDRGYVEINHRHNISNNWLFNTNLSNVTDQDYFEDFGNNIYTTSQSFLLSHMTLNGNGDNWLFNSQFNDYQIISENIALNRQPYQSLPSINYSWFNNSYTSTINYGIDTQWVNFYREQSITSHRFDLIPYVEKTFQNSFSSLTPKLSYRQTNWDYSDTEFSELKEFTRSRSMPIASLDYTLKLEKNFEDGRYSSIEPRLFYLYSPFRDQENIPLFDTHRLTYGTGLLYQTNAFSGSDRQSDANQVSIGITQRHFDETGFEKWNLTLGQIAYFEDRRVQLPNNAIETRSTSPIITELNYFYRNWKATMSVHWDTDIDKSERALLKIQHKAKNNSVFNFAYRFRRGKIEQLDSSVVIPMGINNRFIARWNYSLDAHRTIEAIAGIEHKNCCWATRIVARRYVFNEEGDINNGIFFELQLNGLGSLGRNPRRLLKQSILGYSEEF